MANLSGLTSDKKQTAWCKYVVAAGVASLGKDYTTCCDGAVLVDKKGETITEVKKNTKITILSLQLTEIGKKKFTAANVKVGNRSGYLNLTQINKPTKIISRPSTKLDFGLLETYQSGKTPIVTSNYELNSPGEKERGESDFMISINSVISEPMSLQIGSKTYKNICGVNKVSGTPKADLVFVALAGNKFVEVCFVSHKMGETERNFGQWSGMTENAGKTIATHREVKAFIEEVQKTQDETFKKIKATFTIIKEIENDQLKKRSMYGPNFGGTKGYDNVDFLLQGTPSIKFGSTKASGKLTMSTAIHANGTLIGGGYDPCLMVYRKGDSGDRNQFGILGARFTISPCKGRPIHFVIDAKGKLNSK